MYDLISIGNISVDMYFQGESLTRDDSRFNLAIGGKYLTDYFHEGLGGGGANVAIGVKKFGLHCAIMAKIGNNQFKKLIVQHLEDHGISMKLCQHEEEYLKISSILLSPKGERTIVNYETPHEHLLQSDDVLKELCNAKIVYMSNLPRVALAERIHILSSVEKCGTKTVLNIGSKDCRRPLEQISPLLKSADIIILNGHEFSDLVKVPYEKVDLKKSVLHYLPLAERKILVITDGEKGSYGYVNGEVLYQEAHKVSKIVDTTGAGDGYTAGFIAEYLKTGDVKKSMTSGAGYSVKIIQKIGAN